MDSDSVHSGAGDEETHGPTHTSTSTPTISVDFTALLTTSATRKSMQIGRELTQEEMNALEDELEREIAQQMLEDDDEGEVNVDVDVDGDGSDNNLIVIPESHDLTLGALPPATPSGGSSRPRSFLDRAASICLFTPSRRSDGMVGVTPRSSAKQSHFRSQSQTVTQKLLLTPQASAMQRCMRAAGEAAGIGPSELISQFMNSPPKESNNEAKHVEEEELARALPSAEHTPVLSSVDPAPSTLSSVDSVMLPSSCGVHAFQSPASPTLVEESRSSLLAKIASQDSQIQQAGMLGQQLIEEMEEMEQRLLEEVRKKEEELEQVYIDLDRVTKKSHLHEKQASEWKAQVQQGLDAIALLSEENVRAHTKATIFEASKKRQDLEFESLKKQFESQQNDTMMLNEIQEKLNHSEFKVSKLSDELVHVREELNCANFNLQECEKQKLQIERTLKERDREIERYKHDLQQLQHDFQIHTHEAEQTIERLTHALEDGSNELEKREFRLRQECEKVHLLEKKLEETIKAAKLAAEVASADLAAAVAAGQAASAAASTSTSVPAPVSVAEVMLSPGSKSRHPKGRNARLSGMGYTSLLHELETELSQEVAEIITSPIKKKKNNNSPPKNNAKETSPPKEKKNASPNKRKSVGGEKILSPRRKAQLQIVEQIQPIPAIEPLAMLNTVPAASTASVAPPAATTTVAVAAPKAIPSTPSSTSILRGFITPKPKLVLQTDDFEEGDSPNHPKVQIHNNINSNNSTNNTNPPTVQTTSASVPAKDSLIKRPSSVRKLSSWLSAKVAEAENTLRPMFATLTKSDDESSSSEEEEDDEEASEDDKENQGVAAAATRPRQGSFTSTDRAHPQPINVRQRPRAASTPNAQSMRPAPTPSNQSSQPLEAPATTAVSASDEYSRILATPSAAPSDPSTASIASTAASKPSSGNKSDERIDVLREYFHLATLAVKLSSSNENLKSCNYSVHSLYSEVISADIPFSHWHQWIGERLAEISAQAESHQVLRPRMTPQQRQQQNRQQQHQQQQHHGRPSPSPHKHVPHTPSTASQPPRGQSRPQATPIRIGPFETPTLTKKTISRMTPSGVSTPHSNAAAGSTIVVTMAPFATPQQQQHHQPTPGADQVTRTLVLGESTNSILNANNINNQAMTTPRTVTKTMPMTSGQPPIGSALMKLNPPQSSVGVSVHRPAVRGADRLTQRGGPVLASNVAPAPAAAAAIPPPATPSGLFAKFSNFVTAAPAPTPRQARNNSMQLR